MQDITSAFNNFMEYHCLFSVSLVIYTLLNKCLYRTVICLETVTLVVITLSLGYTTCSQKIKVSVKYLSNAVL